MQKRKGGRVAIRFGAGLQNRKLCKKTWAHTGFQKGEGGLGNCLLPKCVAFPRSCATFLSPYLWSLGVSG